MPKWRKFRKRKTRTGESKQMKRKVTSQFVYSSEQSDDNGCEVTWNDKSPVTDQQQPIISVKNTLQFKEGLVRKREGYQILELYKHHGKETERLEDEPLELQISIHDLFDDDYKKDKEFWDTAVMQLSHLEQEEQNDNCKEDEEFWRNVVKEISHHEEEEEEEQANSHDPLATTPKISDFENCKEDEEFWDEVAKYLSSLEKEKEEKSNSHRSLATTSKINTFDNCKQDEEFWYKVANELSYQEKEE